MLTKLLATLLYALTLTQSDLDCTITTVDSDGYVGLDSSLALDSGGYPVISYYDWDNGALKLAHCHDETCTFASLQTVDSDGKVGYYSSLALNSGGYPVISYYDWDNGALKLARCHDEICTFATLQTVDSDGDVGYYSSLALDSSGYPVISYYDQTNDDLKLTRCYKSTCPNPTQIFNSEENRGRRSSLALDAHGYLVVSYVDGINSDLKLARCHDEICTNVTVQTVDSDGDVADSTSLALNTNGYPVMSYFRGNDLKLARCYDEACTSATLQTVDTEVRVSISYHHSTSLALDANDYPVISYFRGDDLKLARCYDETCTSATLQTVDTQLLALHSRASNPLVLNKNGEPFISYYDIGSTHLKLCYCKATATLSATKSTGLVVLLSVGGSFVCVVVTFYLFRIYRRRKGSDLSTVKPIRSEQGVENAALMEDQLKRESDNLVNQPSVMSSSKSLDATPTLEAWLKKLGLGIYYGAIEDLRRFGNDLNLFLDSDPSDINALCTKVGMNVDQKNILNRALKEAKNGNQSAT